MAPLVIYSAEVSPPCRAVLLAAAAAGIKYELKTVDLLGGETKKEEFKKLNPQHTLPTLKDNDFIIWDSHAIVTYLVDKYAKEDSLYPKDLKKRAVINQRLHFHNAVLFNALENAYFPLFNRGGITVPQESMDAIVEAFGFLEQFLGANDWLAGSTYTLADTSIIPTVSSLTALVPLDKFPKLAAWAKRCKETLPGYEKFNAPGADILNSMVKAKLNL